LFNTPSEKAAIELLTQAGCTPNVIQHCKAVAHLATKLAQQILKNGYPVDIQLVKIGALLHDIGRAVTHNINHGIIGAEIAHSYNLPKPIIQIIEKHIGSGITINEALQLGLPKKSYLPRSLEEKIVCYSDKLIYEGRQITFEKALKTFSEELGGFLGLQSVRRLTKLHHELSTLVGE
jgi:uncharacterized protein